MWGSVEEKGRNVAELVGLHRYQLDDKGRIALPAKFRAAFAEGVFLTLGVDGCLWGFPSEEWERRSQEVRAGLGEADRHRERMFFAFAEAVALRQGRLTIPGRLREQVSLGREVVVVGVSSRIEIWPAATWERYERDHMQTYLAGAAEGAG
jgi:MraZ protein